MTLCVGGCAAGQNIFIRYGQTRIMVHEYQPLSGPLSDPRTTADIKGELYELDVISVDDRQVSLLRPVRMTHAEMLDELLSKYAPAIIQRGDEAEGQRLIFELEREWGKK